MKPTDFARLVTRYLGQYCPGQRNLSPQTIQSYRDTFTLLLRGWVPEAVTLAVLDRARVEGFLDWLEQVGHCRITKRNQRLAALHAFFRLCRRRSAGASRGESTHRGHPVQADHHPAGRLPHPHGAPTLVSPAGSGHARRAAVLLAVLYDTGARVQELVDLTVRDCRLTPPAVVTLTGKGRKARQVPLMAPTVALLQAYVAEWRLNTPGRQDAPLFANRQRRPVTRAGVAYLLAKYSTQARTQDPEGFPARVTPHVLRHTKAMHLVQANVNLIYIRDLLGHTDVATTKIYARADAETKRAALTRVYGDSPLDAPPAWWEDDADLMRWLRSVCRPES
ncbi:MAG: tyrosine-type recombinase/integrase [Clostridia bacterium]